MSQEVASLFATLRLHDEMTPALKKAEGNFQSTGSTARQNSLDIEKYMKAAAGTVVSMGVASTVMSVEYDRNFANVRAITGQSVAEMEGMKDKIRGLTSEFAQSPMALSNAYYDVVGGVADASKHMDILRASAGLADAQQADLSITTEGLVKAMNAYSFEADKAMRVSDIYNRTIQVGVGRGSDFVAAMSPIASTMAGAKVSLEETGAAMGYLTMKGAGVGQAATMLSGAVSNLLKPNADMAEGLAKIGFASGSAALAQLGLAGTIQALNSAYGGNIDALAQMFGDQEAFRGALALTKEEFNEFQTTFNEGIDGSTWSSQQAQMESVGYQWDQLKGKVESYMIAVGDMALPTILDGLQEGSWMLDILFPSPEEVKEDFQAAIGPIEGPAAITYQIQPGDTPQDVARELNITVQEAQRLMREQGAFVSVGVDPSLGSFAATLQTDINGAIAIAEKAGFSVSPAVTITPQMVLDELTKRGLGKEAYEAVEQEMKNAAEANRTVNLPTTIDANVIGLIATASGKPYNSVEAMLADYVGGREYSSQVVVGATVSVQPRTADGKPFDFNAVMQREIAERTKGEDVIEIDAGDQKVALLVSAGIAIENFLMNSETSEEDSLKIYETVQGWVDDIGPIEIDIADIALGVKNVFIANPLDLARDINDTLMGAANGVSDWADQNIGTRDANDLAQYSNDWIAQRESNSFMYPRPTQQSGSRMDYIDIVPQIAEDADPNVTALVMGEALPTATASVDMTQPTEGFDAFWDDWAKWRDTAWATTVDVYVNVHGAGPNGEGTAEGIDAGGAAVTRGIPQYADGGYTGGGGLAMLHPDEWVVPAGGMMVKPSSQGLVMEGGFSGGVGGGGININTVNVYGVQNPEQLFDQLEDVKRKRGR